MRNARIRVPWGVLCTVVVMGLLATVVVMAAPWQGLQTETKIEIDVAKPESAVPLDLEPSAFTFEPVKVTVHRSKNTAKISLRVKFRNSSDRDYLMYGTANLLDADGKLLATKSKTEEADDDDNQVVTFRFRLPHAEADRVKACGFKFAFEQGG
ncbi:MAG: hypothetical protein KBD01_00480 [Acidobacteria bacterium]|nr:hypothetical protein [Acidobacteriota bacterium]